MHYYQCPECEGTMISIDSSIAWDKLELYFCTECYHARWLSSDSSEYVKLIKSNDITIDKQMQEAIESVLKRQRYQSIIFLLTITLISIVIIALVEG